MDGKGAWRDNVFVERLWRTIKYEEVYLRAYASVFRSARVTGPIHRPLIQQPADPLSLDRQTPDEAYFNALTSIPVAA